SNGTARVESVENLAALRVEYQEVAGQLAGENQMRRCRRHGGDQRPLRLIFPGDFPSRSIEGREPPPGLLQGIVGVGAAHVELPWYVAWLVRPLERAAPIHGRCKEQVRPRIERRRAPLQAAQDAWARIHPLERRLSINVRARCDWHLE